MGGGGGVVLLLHPGISDVVADLDQLQTAAVEVEVHVWW